ncbi:MULTISPECIES: hypothetical protein [Pseudomonas syringae group]|uniref:hypothetical protein n=1 Tax=Pseudomonas syringae group TaxID=136849 RepID=UPI000EFF95B6|nr:MULTISPECIES: hypothetical protein [Pseudomonas syringae group]MCF5805950.1 hypothetical protein [Pseudomonas tremae]MCF5810760.1 hypothetical protein [Pseudomonas tremae]
MAPKDRKFPIHDLIIALLRDQNIHEGYWGLSVQFEANGVAVPSNAHQGQNLPGLSIGVSGVTLVPAGDGEIGALDASLVNPLKKKHPQTSVEANIPLQ